MRHLFHSKDHKQQQSLRLQKELQKEEETLWKIEQEKRKLQEELDMKMAKKLQEEMEHREQDPQRQEQQQQPELTDEEVARRLQEELNRGQSPTHDASPSPSPAPAPAAPPPPVETRSNQELSDEQYARMLQEQFEAEERQAQEQRGSRSSPALPPRTLSSDNTTPSSSVAPPPLPSKPVAYNHSTHSLGHGSTSRPSWINHASSSSTSSSINLTDQPVAPHPPPPGGYPSASSSSSLPGSYPPQPTQPPQPASPVAHTVYSNASIPPPYHPPATTTSSTGYPPYPSSPSQQQQPQQPQWAAYPSPTPHPQQSYHTQPSPSSPAQQHPQQSYYAQPPPSSPAQQQPQQPHYTQPPPPPSPSQQQEHRPITQQQEPSTATMGSTLFSPKNDPVMFIVPPAQQPSQQQDTSQHPAFMPMPAPEDHQRTMYPPPQQPSTHVNQQQQQQQPYPQQPQEQQLDEEYRSVKPTQSSSSRRVRDPTPPPSRSTTRVSASSAKKSDTNPFADSFAAEVSEDESSSEEEEEEEEEKSTHKDEHATVITKQADKDNQQQHQFDPSRYFDDEDLVDLNAPAHHDEDDDDGSSDDGSYVGPVSSKPAVEMAVQTEPVSDETDIESKANENEVDAVKDAGVDSKGIQATQTTSSNETTKDKPAVPEESLLDIDLEPTPVQRPEPRARAISNVDTKAEIQRRLAEQMKKSSATRVDPTFGISMGPPPATAKKPGDSDKTQEEEEEERAKDDKVQETLEHQESMHSLTPGPSMFYHHHRSQSASVLVPPGTGHIPQATPYMNHTAYDDMAYTPTPVVYPANVLRAGAPPTMSPEPNEAGLATTVDNMYEVPSNEYGYYHVDSNGYPTKDDSDAKSVKSNMTANPKDKALPKIPKSDPNHRHITVPSVNPGQRVWIRLNPTDTGKALAQRIHVVATYKSRKILSIKTTSGRVIPLDDTPVFDDWTEIANLEDGAPWEVEWGQLDDPFSGGRALIKSIKASLLAGKD